MKSSRSGRKRGPKKQKSNKLLDHKHEESEFEMEITGIFKDALTHQATVAIQIQKLSPLETLNSKREFNAAPIARVMVGKKNSKFKAKARPQKIIAYNFEIICVFFVVEKNLIK